MSARQAAAPRRRLEPEERRTQLVQVAARRLSRGGVDALAYTELAEAAGVTRPVLYRFFPTRESLIAAILADFEEELARAFERAAQRTEGAGLETATRAFIEAICDAIELHGAGAWELLGGVGPDASVARLGRATQSRLVEPWLVLVGRATGAPRREVETVTAMFVAAGRAALARWYAGPLTRSDAVRDATRGVSALLAAFARR